MNDIVKLCLFYSYYGKKTCNKFAPYGHSNVERGLWYTLVEDLIIGDTGWLIGLWNPKNQQQFISCDSSGKWVIWVENNNALCVKFAIDYWLDKMVDNVS